MQITNCKLIKIVQKKLLEFFVLQVTARSAADILDIQPNSAILFYRKIRIPFITNPTGRPIVIRAVLEGRQEPANSPRRKWQSSKAKPN